jgi:hypothetical protein
MKSATVLNYETRPCKFAERRMLLASIARIMGVLKLKYQYIGFGGLSFTDFKLFHKELHIKEMYSIEAKYEPNKLVFNKPYSCINILHGESSDQLSLVDLSKPSIVWLDYDNTLSMTFFTDIELVLREVPHGSIIIISCNRELKNGNTPYTNEEFKEIYGSLVPYDITENCCADINSSETIKRMLEGYCHRIIKERNSLGDNISFVPLYNIKYAEYRGARMFTFGGIVLSSECEKEDLNIDGFDFISTVQPYEINIPNLTYREASYLNQILDIEEREKELIDKKILTATEVEKYKRIYRFPPHFYDVRL